MKKFLINVAKNAVNAVLTNAALMAEFPQVFHTHSKAGWIAIGKAALDVVLAREALVYVPKILKWSSSTDDTQ